LKLSSRIKIGDAFPSAISAVEVLGFPGLTDADRQFHENQFATLCCVEAQGNAPQR
jgi:hypothetical protein